MKYIVKSPEPRELLDWKAQDRMYMRNRPNYDRIPGEVRRAIYESLCAEQGNICCYCERSIIRTDSHIEHIKPQRNFPMLSCDYNNMVCSCQLEMLQGDPRHCGMSKGSWYTEELFISPLEASCEGKFIYTLDGQIQALDQADQAAINTIDKCKLRIDKLKSLRRSVIDTFTDDSLSPEDLTTFVQHYLVEKEENKGSYNDFYTTIKYLFGHLIS